MYLGKKSTKFFPAGPFFLVLQLNAYRSALFYENVPALKNSWLRAWVQVSVQQSHEFVSESRLRKQSWTLKIYLAVNGTEFNLKWNTAAYATPYRCGTRRCDLCLTEKYIIARANQNNLLNKRTELISKCLHRNKYI